MTFRALKCARCGRHTWGGYGAVRLGRCSLEPWHPLVDFSGGVVCAPCFDDWNERQEFARLCLAYQLECVDPRKEAVVFSDESVLMILEVATSPNGCNPVHLREAGSHTLRIWLGEAGTSVDIALDHWTNCHQPEYPDIRTTSSTVRKILSDIWPRLKNLFPTSESVLQKVDIEKIVKAKQKWLNENPDGGPPADDIYIPPQPVDPQLEAWNAEREQHNLALHKIYLTKPNCPHCSATHDQLRYYDNRRNPERRSCFICQACARSSQLDQMEGRIFW